MKSLFAALLFLPVALSAAERAIKIDPSRSYVDVDVKSTVDDFTAHLDAYALRAVVDDKGKIKTGAAMTFKFADLKTGKEERDHKMLEWLGGDDPAGKFELGILALTPDGQGQANGNLTFHGATTLIEFPVNVSKAGETYTITGEALVDYRSWKLKVIRSMGVLKVDPFVKVRFKFTGEAIEAAPAK
ncbi:MAG TPA: YceI family protein [Lacunisphaera sp.]|nr:YceI family protein [Lacunisphaera sp.]